MNMHFYRAFEDRYRGSRELIKQRLRQYQPFMNTVLAQYPAAGAIDLGCGRGEWLELLGELGFQAQGVDLDAGMLAACIERGLVASNADALTALAGLEDQSMAVVSAFHLVEHIPFDQVRALIAQAHRVLVPGGLLILETPNPENIVVGSSDFYTDPSHQRPIPPNLLSFASEHGGFQRHVVMRLQEDEHLHGDRPLALLSVLEGASPDYSVIAQKSAEPALLAAFDALFDARYGLDMKTLAVRYEEQAASRNAEIHHLIGNLANRISADRASSVAEYEGLQGQQHALQETLRSGLDTVRAELAALVEVNARVAESIDDATRLNRTIESILQREQIQANELMQANRLVEERAQQISALKNSRSWRVTAPLRSLGTAVRILRTPDGQARSRGKSAAIKLLRRAASEARRRPWLMRLAKSLLARTPGLRSRLHGMIQRASSSTDFQQGLRTSAASAMPGEEMPSHIAHIYRELKQAQQARKTN